VEQEFDPFFVAQVREGKCVLFAGAGLSAAAGYPSWSSLVHGVMDAAKATHPDVKVAGLEALLAEGKLLEAAAYLRDSMGAEEFFAALRALLEKKEVPPSAVHRLLPRFRFRAIVTTNFDHLIERAFDGRLPIATQKDADDQAKYLGEETPFLFKVHGDIDRPDTIVLTVDEFAQEIIANKALKNTFGALVLTSPLLFVGYSHSDPDFDLFLREHVQVYGKGGARRYALMRSGDEKDEILQDLLRKKSITVLPYARHEELPAFFDRLKKAVDEQAERLTTRPPQPSLQAGIQAVHRRARPAPAQPGTRYAVVIPGLFASKLAVKEKGGSEESVWLDLFRLLNGGMDKLDLAAPSRPRVTATDILAQFSQELVTALEQRGEVLPIPYDWRLDYRASADRLSDFLKREIPDDAPCDLIGIAEGGLVARAFVADYRGEWRRLRSKQGGRLLMLGTANHGSFPALQTLLGSHSLVTTLGRLDLRHSVEEVRRIVASFPSLYQTLPSPLINAAWNALYRRESYGNCEVSATLLEDGLQFHKEIFGSVDPDRMVCILGDGNPTVVSLEDPQRLDQEQQWALTPDGDGSVAHQYARLEMNGRPVPTYFASVSHSMLGNDALIARAVVEILDTGKTTLLPTEPPARR